MIRYITSFVLVLLLFSGCVDIPQIPKMSDFGLNKEASKVYTSDKDVLMFILDASGSMGERDSSGKIKMDAAKEMLRDISSQIESRKTNVGLIGFSGGCRSTELLIEPSNNDLQKVVNVSNAIAPAGSTPLAASIRAAGEVLKTIKQKVTIIIISDGEETCGGNPVSEAQRLKSIYGIDAKIYVIGYSVGSVAKTQLENLAKAGGGNYYDARDGAALSSIITNITDELDIKSDNWKGDTFKFKINFDSGSNKLKEEYNQQVETFADYLKKTGHSAELQGHTDSEGSEKSNKSLSLKRAQSVVDKLVAYGVEKNKVYAVGFGELAPIASNETKDGRFENRRVEAHLIKDGKMDISYINAANAKNAIDVRKATNDSFIGYYKVEDPTRTYAQYHIWMELYANEQGVYGEYQNNTYLLEAGKNDLAWFFSNKDTSIKLDYSNKGKKAGWAQFEGKIQGNTNSFQLSGFWGGGKKGSVVMTRISADELACMKNVGLFTNGTCSK